MATTSLKSSQLIEAPTTTTVTRSATYTDSFSSSDDDDDDDREETEEIVQLTLSQPIAPVVAIATVAHTNGKCTFFNAKTKIYCTRTVRMKGDPLCTYHHNRSQQEDRVFREEWTKAQSSSLVAHDKDWPLIGPFVFDKAPTSVETYAKTSTKIGAKTNSSTNAVSTSGTKIKKSVVSPLISSSSASIVSSTGGVDELSQQQSSLSSSSPPSVKEERELIDMARRFILPKKLAKVEKLLREGPCQSGSIYLFQKEHILSAVSGRMLVKIGRTSREKVQTRIDEWKNSGGLPMNVHSWPVSHNVYAEKVIHLLLGATRVHIDAKDAKGKSKKEIEWFDIDVDVALKIVQRAVAFINKNFP